MKGYLEHFSLIMIQLPWSEATPEYTQLSPEVRDCIMSFHWRRSDDNHTQFVSNVEVVLWGLFHFTWQVSLGDIWISSTNAFTSALMLVQVVFVKSEISRFSSAISTVNWSLEFRLCARWNTPDTVIQCGCLHNGSSSTELNGYCQL